MKHKSPWSNINSQKQMPRVNKTMLISRTITVGWIWRRDGCESNRPSDILWNPKEGGRALRVRVLQTCGGSAETSCHFTASFEIHQPPDKSSQLQRGGSPRTCLVKRCDEAFELTKFSINLLMSVKERTAIEPQDVIDNCTTRVMLFANRKWISMGITQFRQWSNQWEMYGSYTIFGINESRGLQIREKLTFVN